MISIDRRTVILCFCLFLSLLGYLLVSNKSKTTQGDVKDSKPVPVIIFKLPRTGSSWFNQELNSIPTVFISKEILQNGDPQEFSSVDIEKRLIDALSVPTGRIID